MIKTTKESISLSNNTLQSFKPNLTKISNNLYNCKLLLNNGSQIFIPMRDDGYINVTLLISKSGKN